MSVLLIVDNVEQSETLTRLLYDMGINAYQIQPKDLIINGGQVNISGMIDDDDYGINAIVSSSQYSWVHGIKSSKELINMLRKECKSKLNILLICIDDDKDAKETGWIPLLEDEYYTDNHGLAKCIATLIDLKNRWEDPAHPDYGLEPKEYEQYMHFCSYRKEGKNE